MIRCEWCKAEFDDDGCDLCEVCGAHQEAATKLRQVAAALIAEADSIEAARQPVEETA